MVKMPLYSFYMGEHKDDRCVRVRTGTWLEALREWVSSTYHQLQLLLLV